MWVLLSCFAALCAGTSDALSKKGVQNIPPLTMAWIRPGYAALFLVPLIFIAPAPHAPAEFWTAIAIAVPLEITGSLLFYKALEAAPLSTVIPYMAFTPAVLLLFGWLVAGDQPHLQGIVGVLTVTIGAFILQAKGLSLRAKGPALMLATAFVFALTTAFAKKALMASSVYMFASVYFGLTALGLLPLQFRHSENLSRLISRPGLFLLLGLVEASGLFVQFHAMRLTDAAYVLAIKRLSLLVSVFYGWAYFKEIQLFSRLIGAAIMVAGAILIALS